MVTVTIYFAAECLLVFVAMIVTDIVWAQYTHAVSSHNLRKAPPMAVAIIGIGAFVTTSYVENHWLIIPAAIGAYIGTFMSVWWEKRKG